MAGIKSYIFQLLEDYRFYRGQDLKSPDFKPFWDAVVMTTSDEDQKTAFLQQIQDKRERGELPKGLPVHVVADPPGARIGNGGSTLTVLEHLSSFYDNDLDLLCTMKIFLIHAGGWSQRLPSAAALGKVFSILPYGYPPFQMLDLKLALYWPFVEKIHPGIFLVCADDFSVHNLDMGDNLKSEKWDIPRNGFTALSHPSPLDLGRAHGVFVIDGVGGRSPEKEETAKREGVINKTINEREKVKEMSGKKEENAVDFSKLVVIRKCVEVLQKPSEERMRSHGAVFRVGSGCITTSSSGDTIDINNFGDGVKVVGDVVYTDSCFYMGTDVVKKLFHLKKSLGDLNSEIDAYGDFLQAVGGGATVEYVQDNSNVSFVSEGLVETRTKVFNALNGSDIHVVLLNSSYYTHIGTIKELLWYMCRDGDFQDRLSLGKNVFNLWIGRDKNGIRFKNETDCGDDDDNDDDDDENSSWGKCNRGTILKRQNKNDKNVSDRACIIHSSINRKSRIGDNSFLEFCDIEMGVNIVGNSVVSNCKVSCDDLNVLVGDEEDDAPGCSGSLLTVPENTFIHTVPILLMREPNRRDDRHTAVTAAENINNSNNDEKKSCKNDNLITEDKNPTSPTHHRVTHDVINYVTIILNVDDDTKKSVPISELGSLPFNGYDFDHFLSQRSMTIGDVLPLQFPNKPSTRSPIRPHSEVQNDSDTTRNNQNRPVPASKIGPDENIEASLWDLKVFPAFSTMTSSFIDAIRVKQGHRVKVGEIRDIPTGYYSLSEIRTLKDVKTMLEFRRQLYNKIKDN